MVTSCCKSNLILTPCCPVTFLVFRELTSAAAALTRNCQHTWSPLLLFLLIGRLWCAVLVWLGSLWGVLPIKACVRKNELQLNSLIVQIGSWPATVGKGLKLHSLMVSWLQIVKFNQTVSSKETSSQSSDSANWKNISEQNQTEYAYKLNLSQVSSHCFDILSCCTYRKSILLFIWDCKVWCLLSDITHTAHSTFFLQHDKKRGYILQGGRLAGWYTGNRWRQEGATFCSMSPWTKPSLLNLLKTTQRRRGTGRRRGTEE